MYKILFIILLQAIYIEAYAQKTLLNALYGSQQKITISNIDPEFETKKDKVNEEKMNSTKACTSETQTSIPLRMVLGLLRGKGATLHTSYDADSGKVSIYGGPMIGNCNSMLEYYWGQPEGDAPYTFEVRIKRPSGCADKLCKYNVQTLKDEKVVELSEPIEVEPNLDGFVKCLQKTGVYNGSEIDKSKIVSTEFNVEKTGINKSGEVWFMSTGPAAANSGGGVFSKKNLLAKDDCKYYENIQKGGYTVYTKADVEKKLLIEEAQVLCKSKNYAEIYGNLKNFQSLSGTYKDLEKIMKEQLLREVAKAKKEFDKAVEKGDLSKIDTEKYATLFKDFYELIVQKHFDDDVHNGADENDMSLLINLYTAYEEADSPEAKAEIEKKIRDLSKDLNKYMQEPYFTLDDYKHFISMKNKAPLKDPKWKEATSYMHKALISLKLSCQAYSVDNSGCSASDKSENMKDMADIVDIRDKVESYASKASKLYQEREYVLKNPDSDNSQEFSKLIKNCEKLYSEKNQKQMYYQQYKGQYNMMAQQKCQNKNPYVGMFGGYGGYYANKLKQCIEDENESFRLQYTVNSTKIKMCDSQISKYKGEYNKWKDLENLRDDYYYGDGEDDDDDQASRNNDGSYSFNFTPGQTQMPQNQWYNQSFNQQQQQYNPMMTQGMNMYNPNNFSMMNQGYGMNQGFGLQAGFGLNGGMGMNQGFGRYPSMYGMQQNQGYNMMPGYNNYMGNMSAPGGAYNFTYGH